MWGKRQRYIFRKRSKRGRILWLVAGFLVVTMGLLWLMPWLTLSTPDVGAPMAGASKDQAEETLTTEEQPAEDTTEEQPKDTLASTDTAQPQEEASTNSSSAASVQPSPPASVPPSSPAPPSAPYEASPPASGGTGFASTPLQAPNNYLYYGPNYSDYWGYGTNYPYYRYYSPNYWGY